MKYTYKDIKKFPKINGVYKLYFENSTSSKFYIGSASGKMGFYGRWKSHISILKNNKSKNKILQSATNNIENIVFEIIYACSTKECLLKEQFFIDKYDTFNNGYNGRPNASNNGCLPMSIETKSKISNKWRLKRDLYMIDVKNLYENEKKTTREICDILNISRNFLRKIFIENNIEPRKERGLPKMKIYQYKKGTLIKEWNSLTECIENSDFNSNGIRSVLTKKSIYYKGFYFSYKNLQKNEILEIENKFKILSKSSKYKYYT